MDWDESERKQMQEAFAASCRELLEQLTQSVLLLEQNGPSEAQAQHLRRIFHTLKGDGAAAGWEDLAHYAHGMEDLLTVEHLSKSGTIEQLLNAVDVVAARLDGVIIEPSQRPVYAGEAAVAAAARLILTEYEQLLVASVADGVLYKVQGVLAPGSESLAQGSELPEGLGIVVRRDAEGFMIQSSATLVDWQAKRKLIFTDMTGFKRIEQIAAGASAMPAANRSTTVRVESARLDELLNLVGELVIARSMFGQLALQIEDENFSQQVTQQVHNTQNYLNRALADLQKSVMRTRMLPINRVFMRYTRMVRDLGAMLGKEVRLEIQGERTQVDKSIIDLLDAPLTHLIRNAIDHGLETREERVASGKDACGVLTVEARHTSSQVIITVKDDGKGIQRERLLKKAVRSGVVEGDIATTLTDQEILFLVFQPGLSIRDEVTEVSGRGVGLDSVQVFAEELKGSIDVDSIEGEGTTFTLRLPLSVAIVKALLFTVGTRTFALPLSSVREIMRANVEDLQSVDGLSVLSVRENTIPVLWLADILHEPRKEKGRVFFILLDFGRQVCALAIEHFIGEHEIVIKPIEHQSDGSGLVSGASILGDGTVALILDVGALFSKQVTTLRRYRKRHDQVAPDNHRGDFL